MSDKTIKPVSRIGSYILAIIFVGGLIAWIFSGQTDQPEEQLEPKNRIAAVQALPEVQINRFPIESFNQSLTLSGTIVPARDVVVRSETSARITKIQVDEGDIVKRGQLVIELNPGDRLAKIAQARSSVEREQIFFDSQSKLAEKGLGSELDKADAASRLTSAKAQLQSAQEEYRKTRITAPFAGWLIRKHVEIGDFVSPGSALIEVADITPLQAEVFVTEQELVKIRDSEIQANVSLVTGELFTANLDEIAPISDNNNKSFRVTFNLDTTEPINLGLSVTVRVDLASTQAIRISPSVLLLDDAGNLAVKYVQNGDTVAQMPVQLVSVGSDDTWISGDNIENRDIIITGQGFVQQGDKVVPKAIIDNTSRE